MGVSAPLEPASRGLYPPPMRSFGLMIFALALACGDTSGKCDDAWCQGDPVGAWKLTADAPCLSEPITSTTCAGFTCTLASASASGTLTLPAGGDGAAVDLTASGTLECVVPIECTGDAGCDSVAGDCTIRSNGTACDCELEFSTASKVSGTWARDPSGVLKIENAALSQQWATSDYCVAGGGLDLGVVALQAYAEGVGLVSIGLRARATAD